MLGFAALAETALAEVPGIVEIIQPPRQLTGKIFTLDTVQNYFFGTAPNKDESCALVFYVGDVLPTNVPVQFFFTRPDGTQSAGDPNFAYVGNIVMEIMRETLFAPAQQYAVYLFGIYELDQRGFWQVSMAVGGYHSRSYRFVVN